MKTLAGKILRARVKVHRNFLFVFFLNHKMMQTILISGCNMGLTTSKHIKKKKREISLQGAFISYLRKKNILILSQNPKLENFFLILI
jgi:hypothetical protein